jgi:hypothetical protein
MFWRSKSPIDRDDKEWQLECWRWLLKHHGGVGTLSQRMLVIPTQEYIRWPHLTGQLLAENVFGQVAKYAGVNPSDFEIVAQAESIDPVLAPLQVVVNAPVDAAGTFSLQGNRMQVTYNPALLKSPMKLVATFAHEISHPLLLSVPGDPPGGMEMEEFATDLAVIFFGFGVISVNTTSNFVGFRDDATGTQGWQFDGLGYLSLAERTFALAVFLALAGRDAAQVLPFLESGPAAYFKKALKYVSASPSMIASLREEFP